MQTQTVTRAKRFHWLHRAGKAKFALLPDPLVKLLKNPVSMSGIVLLLLFGFMAVAAPYLAPPDNWSQRYQMPRDGFSQTPKPPQAEAWATFPPDWHLHPFGTSNGQYDIYYGIVWGARSAFRLGIIIVGLSLSFGLLMGTLAGYFGGLFDDIVMRVIDVLYVFPGIVWTITLLVVFSQPVNFLGVPIRVDRLTSVVIALVSFGWLTYARLIRGDILATKEKDYIQAARAQGASNARIILKHLLPNTIYPVFVVGSLDIGSIVLSIAALSFLGLGPGIGYADWGQLVSFSRQWIIGSYGNPFEFWYVILFPGAAITLFVLAWNLVGDAVRDIMDPKLRGSRS